MRCRLNGDEDDDDDMASAGADITGTGFWGSVLSWPQTSSKGTFFGRLLLLKADDAAAIVTSCYAIPW